MKALLVCMLIVISLFFISKSKTIVTPVKASVAPVPHPAILMDTVSFTRQIQPILVNNCSPCHFTGGKMYEKLPFDKKETIVDHGDALLRRIKNEKEKALIKEFIQQQQRE